MQISGSIIQWVNRLRGTIDRNVDVPKKPATPCEVAGLEIVRSIN